VEKNPLISSGSARRGRRLVELHRTYPHVPSLINEPDACHHEYFWNATRAHHVEWASMPGRERVKSRMKTYYEPLWVQMEPIINEMNQRAGT
jgi:hypothetical protein